jgi:DNA-binding IclR family transcriptional regulator
LQRSIDCGRRLRANAAAVGKVIYRQGKPETRTAIINCLKELN